MKKKVLYKNYALLHYFRYSIHGESTLELKINNDALIWKKYVNNNEGWNEAIVILPAPDVK